MSPPTAHKSQTFLKTQLTNHRHVQKSKCFANIHQQKKYMFRHHIMCNNIHEQKIYMFRNHMIRKQPARKKHKCDFPMFCSKSIVKKTQKLFPNCLFKIHGLKNLKCYFPTGCSKSIVHKITNAISQLIVFNPSFP